MKINYFRRYSNYRKNSKSIKPMNLNMKEVKIYAREININNPELYNESLNIETIIKDIEIFKKIDKKNLCIDVNQKESSNVKNEDFKKLVKLNSNCHARKKRIEYSRENQRRIGKDRPKFFKTAKKLYNDYIQEKNFSLFKYAEEGNIDKYY
eukprot:Mrub_11587.p2 GENE.Mrub_11587~~Mrub_11587.p2  ORF type:complete len:174 (+),score=16.19 Mrub_11587:68-523(+)